MGVETVTILILAIVILLLTVIAFVGWVRWAKAEALAGVEKGISQQAFKDIAKLQGELKDLLEANERLRARNIVQKSPDNGKKEVIQVKSAQQMRALVENAFGTRPEGE